MFAEWIEKLSHLKFVRKFQYEPHIIKTIEHINPQKGDIMLTIYKEVDYLQGLALNFIERSDYYSCNVTRMDECGIDTDVDYIVLFFVSHLISEKNLNNISKYLKKGGKLYDVSYLKGGKLFELALKLSDSDAYKVLNSNGGSLLKDSKEFSLIDNTKFKKHNIKIDDYLHLL